ncbi:MAG: Gldg family protein [Limnochordales bacterium]|nr:Gldg family protein [Limnochordales bacterium]
MSGLWTIYRKELRSFLVAPLTYVLVGIFLVLGGYFFWVTVVTSGIASLAGFFGNTAIVLIFLMPVLTMRLWSEEEAKGTAELLLTSPVSLGQIVVGKYLAAVTLFAGMLVLTAGYPLVLYLFGDPQTGPLIAGYIGFLLLGAAFIAAGMFTSTLTDNQVIAAVTGFGILLLLWLLQWAGDALGGGAGEVLRNLSAITHFVSFSDGLLAAPDVIYYLAVIVGFLLLAIRNLGRRLWRSLETGAQSVLLTAALVGILVVVNILAARMPWQLDLSAEGRFTLSDQTKQVLREQLPGPVEITAFVRTGDDSPVPDLVRAYAKASDRVQVSIVDPLREPSLAQQYGVQQYDTVVVQQGGRTRKITPDSLYTLASDGFSTEFNGEQAITRAILELVHEQDRKVAFLIGHGEVASEDELASLFSDLEGEGYSTEFFNLAETGSIPAATSVVAVAGPQSDLGAQELDVLRRFVQAGGKLLLLLDPVTRALPGWESLAGQLGVQVTSHIVVDPERAAFLDVLSPMPELLAHPITNPLIERRMEVLLPRSVGLVVREEGAASGGGAAGAPGEIKTSALLRTSSEAWGEKIQQRVQVRKDPEDPVGPFILAVAVEGRVAEPVTDSEAASKRSSTASGGTGADGSGQDASQPGAESEGEWQPLAVVVGNSTFIRGQFLNLQGNRDFLLNALNWLTGRKSLISIRPKVFKVPTIALTPRLVWNTFYAFVVIMPLASLFVGGWTWWRRRAL